MSSDIVQEQDLDPGWVDSFLDRVLASWRRHADTESGLFNPYLDREWRHQEDGPRTLVSQCRLCYNFARAYERNGDHAYAELAHRGLDALVRSFRHADGQGWAWSCRADGSVQDDTDDAYGHAFVILALATAATVFQERRYRDLALQTWTFMQARFGDDHGGLIWHVGRDGQAREEVRSQNPLMHTFESLLVLAPLDESGAVGRDAARIWPFLSARMATPGALPEWYDADWRPLDTGDRAVVEVGHVFEWAWLLSEARPILADEELLEHGRQMLAYGMRVGYDAGEGGIFSQVEYDGRRRGQRKGWWEQCEAIRAMKRYVSRHGATELAEPVDQSIAFVRRHFVDEEYGGWYLNPPAAGGTPSLAKGNAYKLDYHVLNMCLELLAD